MTTALPALVVVAHGSPDPRSAGSARQLLDVLRTRATRARGPVALAFLDHDEPRLDDALEDLYAGGVRAAVAVPLLLTAAYHSQVDLPAMLDRVAQRHPDLELRQAGVLGPDQLLLGLLTRRLAQAGVRPGDPSTAVVLAAAGSSDARAVAAVAAVAQQLAAGGWWAVTPAFASTAEPTVAEALADVRRRGAPRVAVASYLLGPGRLPDVVRSAAGDLPVSAPLGAADEVAAVVEARYAEAIAR